MNFLRTNKPTNQTTSNQTVIEMKGLGKSESSDSDFGWIGRGIEVNGDIAFSEKLQVDGRVTGKLTSDTGTLVIGESGRIDSQIDVGVCVVHGELQGNIIARSKLEIRKTGRVHGDVVTPVLLVEEGAVFNGAIRMTQETGGRLIEDVRLTDIDGGGRRQASGA
jgi:cytoskeletal protein CcmA (bactofilin family)